MVSEMKTETRKKEPTRPPQGFGDAVLRLANSVGKTKADILRATGKQERTFGRLNEGRGSLIFAHSVVRVLKSWGADVSKLPGLDETVGANFEPWMQQWIEVGERLHEVDVALFESTLQKAEAWAKAAELIADAKIDISRAT